jgi:anti-anti-sigma factor
MWSSSLSGFGVSVAFVGDRAVLGIRGEVDILTAPDLGALVDAVIDQGHRFVVLDLAALDFMDASGLRVIARAARRLNPAAGELAIRSPSRMVRRILDLTGLTAVVRLEHPEPAPGRLGREQAVEAATTTAPDGLAHRLGTVTALPADNDVIAGALRMVVALARATVGGADGVSVSLRRHGRLATVAASDQTISDMDVGQYATGQGPCVDASVQGRWFHVESLDTETRWPAFTPRAQALGIHAILSSPLLARDQPVGALNIYSRTPAAFTPTDQKLASVFATEVSTILTDAGMDLAGDQLAGRVNEALLTRQVIAQAQGVIMQRDGVDEDAAYTALRRMSLVSGMTLREEADYILTVASSPHPPRGLEPEPRHHG